MPKIRVLFFGRLGDAVAAPAEDFELSEPATVADVRRLVALRHPGVAAGLKSAACAVNEAYAAESTPLAGGETVAFLPPVSGG